MSLTREQIVNTTGMKFGPSLKIYELIQQLRHRVVEQSHLTQKQGAPSWVWDRQKNVNKLCLLMLIKTRLSKSTLKCIIIYENDVWYQPEDQNITLHVQFVVFGINEGFYSKFSNFTFPLPFLVIEMKQIWYIDNVSCKLLARANITCLQ